jgi:alpha-D-ribose 1-methylphosphonate 5-triphosphate diphosphatase PhnM
MASAPNVLPIFPEPDGNNSLTAIADAIRKTKYLEGFTNAELAFHLRCDASTVENAEAGRNLLKFDTVARLLRKYPEHTAGVRQLWEMEPVAEKTSDEMIAEALRLIERAQQKRAYDNKRHAEETARKLAEVRGEL